MSKLWDGKFMRRLTKRYIVNSLDGLGLSKPIRYERYYINNRLRIQRKGDEYQKESLGPDNNTIDKTVISESEFLKLKKTAYSEIIRDSYLYQKDHRVSIKKYLGKYAGLCRVEVSFNSLEEENKYIKENWMGKEITYSPLAFDKDLSKLSNVEFKDELEKHRT